MSTEEQKIEQPIEETVAAVEPQVEETAAPVEETVEATEPKVEEATEETSEPVKKVNKLLAPLKKCFAKVKSFIN